MPDYILEPLDTDAEELYQSFVGYIQDYFPDWEPSDGQLDVIVGRYFALQASFTADMASRVQRAIYRYFGSNLAGIPPLSGGPAIARIQFNITAASITQVLPIGTEVGLTDSGGDTHIFALNDDLIFGAGAVTGQGDAEAVDLGVAANDIVGTAELVELVDWVNSLSVVGASSGGTDPEDDDAYIQRLTQNLGLMAPRPILAEDFAIMALNIPSVWRASVIDNFRPGVNEVQRITSNYTGGTFTISFGGETTIAIAAATTADNVYQKLLLLNGFDLNDVIVTGGPLPVAPITITFGGKYAYTDVALMTASTGSLTGGSSFAITNSITGSPSAVDLENAIAISAVDVNGDPLQASVKTQLIEYLESSRAQNFVITYIEPSYNRVRVDYVVRAQKYQNDAAALQTAVDNSLATYLDAANWAKDIFQSQPRTWDNQTVVRYLELTTVVENTPGVDYVESLTFSVNANSFSTANQGLAGIFPLTRASALLGAVNLPS